MAFPLRGLPLYLFFATLLRLYREDRPERWMLLIALALALPGAAAMASLVFGLEEGMFILFSTLGIWFPLPFAAAALYATLLWRWRGEGRKIEAAFALAAMLAVALSGAPRMQIVSGH
jgi:hypothetical protein